MWFELGHVYEQSLRYFSFIGSTFEGFARSLGAITLNRLSPILVEENMGRLQQS